MKNNYKYLFFVFLFFFLKINSLYSDEFTFEAPEIQILDNGNKVIAINGVKILSDDGVEINANNVKDQTSNIRQLKHSNKILRDVRHMQELKTKYTIK